MLTVHASAMETRSWNAMTSSSRSVNDAMRVPSHDVDPGAKAFSGVGARLMRSMGWNECVRQRASEGGGNASNDASNDD